MSALRMLAPGATPVVPASVLPMMPATPVGCRSMLESSSQSITSRQSRGWSTWSGSRTATSTLPALMPRAWTFVALIAHVLWPSSGTILWLES